MKPDQHKIDQKTAIKCSNPICDSRLDGATSLNEKSRRPKEGDLSICVYCCTVSIYKLLPNGDLELVRMPDNEILMRQIQDSHFNLALKKAREISNEYHKNKGKK